MAGRFASSFDIWPDFLQRLKANGHPDAAIRYLFQVYSLGGTYLPLDLEIDRLGFASERPCVCSRSGVVTIYCSLHSPKSRRYSSCYHAAV